MPQFQLNADRYGAHPYYALNEFAKGYVEAMFFTNGDTGDEKRENHLNDLGVERLTHKAVASIKEDCAKFESDNAALLALAYERDYDKSQAGQDFWFTRQGHGVGYWDRKELETVGDEYESLTTEMVTAGYDTPAWGAALAKREVLSAESLGNRLADAARKFGEAYPEVWGGWIHHR